MRLLNQMEQDAIPARAKRPVLKRHRIEGGRGEIYPYDEWADGQWREAVQGEDFDVTTSSFYANMKQWAKRNGGVALLIRAHHPDKVYFKLGPYTEDQKAIRRYYVHPSELGKDPENY